MLLVCRAIHLKDEVYNQECYPLFGSAYMWNI